MNESSHIIGYHAGTGIIYRINASAKLVCFLLVSIACMVTYDTRFLFLVACISLILLRMAHIELKAISTPLKVVGLFALLNLIFVWLFDPEYGSRIYGGHLIWLDIFNLQELFYLLNIALKYFCTVPLTLLFLITTHPSEFASALNKIGVNYKIAYAVSLALRYIPSIQTEFHHIKNAQTARGLSLVTKQGLFQKIRLNSQLLVPLIFSSLDHIDQVSTAMSLRRFGNKKRRSWYMRKPLNTDDKLVIAISFLILGLVILLFFVNHGRFYNPFN